jgi:GMP synthase-like glutamine amidotransferase
VRIGLLQCDALDQRVVSVAGDYDALYVSLLAREGLEFVTFRADLGHLPPSTADCDAWLIGGSRRSVYEDADWIIRLRGFTGRVLADDRPLVGVCFGHQLIGLELGAPVEDVGYTVGAVEYRLHEAPPGVERGDRERNFTVAAIHRDQVLELPAGATLLASADSTPIAGFVYGSRVLGVQPHPEFGREVARTIYDRRADRIGHEPSKEAIGSLSARLDRERVGDWIVAVACS